MVDFVKALRELREKNPTPPQSADPHRLTGKLIAFRRHHTTNLLSQHECEWEIGPYKANSGDWTTFRISKGGVTGYESFVLVDEKGLDWTKIRDIFSWPYWSACAGTPGSWDEMRIDQSEMRRVLLEWLSQLQHEEIERIAGHFDQTFDTGEQRLLRRDRILVYIITNAR